MEIKGDRQKPHFSGRNRESCEEFSSLWPRPGWQCYPGWLYQDQDPGSVDYEYPEANRPKLNYIDGLVQRVLGGHFIIGGDVLFENTGLLASGSSGHSQFTAHSSAILHTLSGGNFLWELWARDLHKQVRPSPCQPARLGFILPQKTVKKQVTVLPPHLDFFCSKMQGTCQWRGTTPSQTPWAVFLAMVAYSSGIHKSCKHQGLPIYEDYFPTLANGSRTSLKANVLMNILLVLCVVVEFSKAIFWGWQHSGTFWFPDIAQCGVSIWSWIFMDFPMSCEFSGVYKFRFVSDSSPRKA